ncbi:hypothetical protein Spb1_17930 [Planctopirus ephydatiae]|uniref:Uncharacterized protein n=1 Tax=Planctopirus ephydatiae TaxID=2528019 RepID=A0A518GMU8_9PLAN|nr:hypothetical protein Spb1_17930 [Planctopirus ephydatiae]
MLPPGINAPLFQGAYQTVGTVSRDRFFSSEIVIHNFTGVQQLNLKSRCGSLCRINCPNN